MSYGLTTGLFLLTVLSFPVFLGWALGRNQENPSLRNQTLTGLVIWMLLTAAIGQSGLASDFTQTPPRFLIVLGVSVLVTTILAFSPFGGHLLQGAGIRGIVAYQAFRIPVELVLFLLYKLGHTPVQMTFEGRNYDILVGIAGLVLAILYRKRDIPRTVLWLWNIAGLGLLVNIVTIAVLSTPVSWRLFHNDPANTIVTGFPYIWLPAVLVQAALLGHLLVFRALLTGRTGEKP